MVKVLRLLIRLVHDLSCNCLHVDFIFCLYTEVTTIQFSYMFRFFNYNDIVSYCLGARITLGSSTLTSFGDISH